MVALGEKKIANTSQYSKHGLSCVLKVDVKIHLKETRASVNSLLSVSMLRILFQGKDRSDANHCTCTALVETERLSLVLDV